MSCRLSVLVLNCRDRETLYQFWCEVLGYLELGRKGPQALMAGRFDEASAIGCSSN